MRHCTQCAAMRDRTYTPSVPKLFPGNATGNHWVYQSFYQSREAPKAFIRTRPIVSAPTLPSSTEHLSKYGFGRIAGRVVLVVRADGKDVLRACIDDSSGLRVDRTHALMRLTFSGVSAVDTQQECWIKFKTFGMNLFSTLKAQAKGIVRNACERSLDTLTLEAFPAR